MGCDSAFSSESFLPQTWKVLAFFDSGLVIEIEGIEDERLALGVEDAAKGLAGTAYAVYVEDVGDVELARAHQFADIAGRR